VRGEAVATTTVLASLLAPDERTGRSPGEPRPIVASAFANYDESGHAGTVDGFTQEINDHGNVTHAQLLSGAATLEYDGLSRLVKVTRLDQSTITYDYRGDGPLVQRTVQCTPAAQGCVSSKRAYIYDGHRLLEEYEIGAQSATLRSRYYYADEAEVPIAAHFLDPQTHLLELHFFVVDRVGSVHGVLDEAGNWVERVRYDAWGRPTIELPDHAVPVIHEIKVEDVTRDILVVFTEPVLPAADAQSAPAIASALEGLTGAFELHAGTDTISVTITYDEMNPNYTRGTVLRLAIDPIDRPADGTSVELEVMGNRLFDRWSNAAGSEQFEIDYEEGYSYPGANQGSTGPQTIAESRVGNVLFFQSHFYDDDADLVHMRARMFNPATGMFLQRDPFGYQDSVNLYAGLGHDPVNTRDPTGAAKVVSTSCSPLGCFETCVGDDCPPTLSQRIEGGIGRGLSWIWRNTLGRSETAQKAAAAGAEAIETQEDRLGYSYIDAARNVRSPKHEYLTSEREIKENGVAATKAGVVAATSVWVFSRHLQTILEKVSRPVGTRDVKISRSKSPEALGHLEDTGQTGKFSK
jgi:RHS repeat-associated protein